MYRVLAIVGIVLVASQIAFAAASKKIGVTGQLNGGMKVSATCTLTVTDRPVVVVPFPEPEEAIRSRLRASVPREGS